LLFTDVTEPDVLISIIEPSFLAYFIISTCYCSNKVSNYEVIINAVLMKNKVMSHRS